ncbi:DUF6046 domain-containing protein [Microscilla marina]|uniref:DUF6046 domain-containing protein n=1 Tax=Microscilla marina ATCC 23134 TaxID=313606 RepID=A1ZLI0_MICM2|nr:DUF6046 domain-containing protein [Microscilla marina]EAY28734.1 hypothetical protein M23134_07832 [Microscilla marina ATCC 23134]
MALFDQQKFLNFYGFVPSVLGVDQYLDVHGTVIKAANRISGAAGAEITKRLDSRPENPLKKSTNTTQNASVFDLTLGEGREKGDAYTFNPPPVISVNLKKNVITTKVAGSARPPVVEMIGHDVFKIKIQGYIENTKKHKINYQPNQLTQLQNALNLVETNYGELYVRDDQFPIDKLDELYQLFAKNEALPVKCKLLSKLGIGSIVITEISDITYYPTAFTYSFNAIADEHKEILVLEK